MVCACEVCQLLQATSSLRQRLHVRGRAKDYRLCSSWRLAHYHLWRQLWCIRAVSVLELHGPGEAGASVLVGSDLCINTTHRTGDPHGVLTCILPPGAMQAACWLLNSFPAQATRSIAQSSCCSETEKQAEARLLSSRLSLSRSCSL